MTETEPSTDHLEPAVDDDGGEDENPQVVVQVAVYGDNETHWQATGYLSGEPSDHDVAQALSHCVHAAAYLRGSDTLIELQQQLHTQYQQRP